MHKLLLAVIAIALLGLAVLAETKSDTAVPAATKSDFDRSYDFSKLRTWDFKVTTRMPEDPVGTNTLWNQRIREGLEVHFAQIGYRKVNDGEPDFLVTYFMGIKEKYDIRYIDYGFPGRWGTWGPWGRWYGWEPGFGQVDVWRIPYHESTLVLDVLIPTPIIWFGVDTIHEQLITRSLRRQSTSQ